MKSQTSEAVTAKQISLPATTGAKAIILSLLNENVDTVFGYIGGAIMPTFDALSEHTGKIRFVMGRHEQGSIHAAQGYARSTGKTGVCIVTSGPGATNIVTGLADAMLDSTPLICIAGQTDASLLGTDAFQEANMMSITSSITKWNFQITEAQEIPSVLAKAFYIANSGRPGPVFLDVTINAQFGKLNFEYQKCYSIRSYNPYPSTDEDNYIKAIELINNSKRPFILAGQGVLLSKAENELNQLVKKADIPVGCTLHGLSALPDFHKLNMGMLGMHGNFGPNSKTSECDLLIAIGMRFNDRVTGNVNYYAKQAKIIHIDIDASEFHKNVKVDIAIHSDAKAALQKLLPHVKKNIHSEWTAEFSKCDNYEFDNVIANQISPASEALQMGEVINLISRKTNGDAIIVTDVGQHQMMAARYYNFKNPRSFITSGGLGTMGFGIPAAIGAKIGNPNKDVILFIGDGGFQMTVQELGTIMEYDIPVKIVMLNNSFLGMVRQWQEMFFGSRYMTTKLSNPDFQNLTKSYGIKSLKVEKRNELINAVEEMLSHDKSYFLEIIVEKEQNVFPMVPAGEAITNMRFY